MEPQGYRKPTRPGDTMSAWHSIPELEARWLTGATFPYQDPGSRTIPQADGMSWPFLDLSQEPST